MNFWRNSGFSKLFTLSTHIAGGVYVPGELIMICLACFFLYLGVKKGYEPYLMIPIAFGMLMANLPGAGLDTHMYEAFETLKMSDLLNPGFVLPEAIIPGARTVGSLTFGEWAGLTKGGLIYYLFQGTNLGIYPPLIFLCIGAGTDFGPLLANPRSLLMGAAAQLGIFVTFIGAILLGFTGKEAASIGIIGGADGPTALFLTTKLAPHLLGAIAIAAYSYMALVPIIQPPIMRLLTTEKERKVRMTELRQVSQTEKIIFPIVVTIFTVLLLPDAGSLIGMLMLGNLLKESGKVPFLVNCIQNSLMYIISIFLGLTVGAKATAEMFLKIQTLSIILLGLIAFSFGTAGGILVGKIMYRLTGGRINPLIGSAGVSAVPMAARVSQKVGQEYDSSNFLLMHAMGPNVAGVIGSAAAAGMLLLFFR